MQVTYLNVLITSMAYRACLQIKHTSQTLLVGIQSRHARMLKCNTEQMCLYDIETKKHGVLTHRTGIQTCRQTWLHKDLLWWSIYTLSQSSAVDNVKLAIYRHEDVFAVEYAQHNKNLTCKPQFSEEWKHSISSVIYLRLIQGECDILYEKLFYDVPPKLCHKI